MQSSGVSPEGCRRSQANARSTRTLPPTKHDLIHPHFSQSPTSAPARTSRHLPQPHQPPLDLSVSHRDTSLNPRPPQLTLTNLSRIQDNPSQGLILRKVYHPPTFLLSGRDSYQMGRFLDEIPDFRKTIVVQEAGLRETVRRKRRYRNALRKRIRMLREVVEG